MASSLELALEAKERNLERISFLRSKLSRKAEVVADRQLKVEVSGGENTKTYAALDWYKENGWVDSSGKVSLEAIASTINAHSEKGDGPVFDSLFEFDNMITEEKKLLAKIEADIAETSAKHAESLGKDADEAAIIKEYADSLVGDKAEAEATIKRVEEQRKTIAVQLGSIATEEVRVQYDKAESGGNSGEPSMVTISFPGRHRSELFRILRLQMLLDVDGDEVHAMNETSKGTGGSAKPLPAKWEKTLGKSAVWSELKGHLKEVKDESGTQAFKDGKSAPEWFVDKWGAAALHCAERNKDNGSGVILLKGWDDYASSPWCKLEFIFAKCLAQTFPGSVYLVNGYDVLKKVTNGEIMKGDESM